jgi:hypothetical protein
LYLFVYDNLPINSVLQHPISEKNSTFSSIAWKKTQFHQFLHVPSCSLKFFDHLGFRALQQAFHLHLPGTLQLFPGGPAGHIVTSHGNHGNPHGHPHGNPQRCGVFSLGSQLETLQETTHLKLLLVKKPRTEVVR